MLRLRNRQELARWLPRQGMVVEIGVERGDFSEDIIRFSSPEKLHLVDPWTYQDASMYPENVNPIRNSQEKQDLNYEFVLRRFAPLIERERVVIHRGYSADALKAFPDKSLDWVYIDGNHSYPFVKEDLELCRLKIKPNGFICGDDYIQGNPVVGTTYGVIQAVDEFCAQFGWKMICQADHCWEGMNFKNFVLAPKTSKSVFIREPFLSALYFIKRGPALLMRSFPEMMKAWVKRENEKGSSFGKFIYKKLKKYRRRSAYGLKHFNEYRKIKRAFGPVLDTPSLKCRVHAPTEIHSLVSHKHLYIYMSAMKSFLRFYDGVSVVVHDDGTLKRSDAEMLKTHLGGIEIIGNTEANERANDILKAFPACHKFRNMRINQRQIFDFCAFAGRNKLIMLDSDTLFFKPPEEIRKWIDSENQDILYVYEEDPCGPIIGTEYITNARNIGKTPFKFAKNLCSGFVCYYKDMMDLELIEEYCAFVLKNCRHERSSFFAQPIIALCAGNSKYKPSILPKSYQNPPRFAKDPMFRHYWRSAYSISGDYMSDAKKVIAQIKSS